MAKVKNSKEEVSMSPTVKKFHKDLIDKMMIKVIVSMKFQKFGIPIRREVDLEKAAKILECDEKIILDVIHAGRMPARRVDGKHLIEVNDLFLLGVHLESENGDKEERKKLRKKLDREWEKELLEKSRKSAPKNIPSTKKSE